MAHSSKENGNSVAAGAGISERPGFIATKTLNYLKTLEAESIQIFREAAAEFARPVMLYSIGKDSSVMLRLPHKAFYPGKIPFPLLHIVTSYKIRQKIEVTSHFNTENRVQ